MARQTPGAGRFHAAMFFGGLFTVLLDGIRERGTTRNLQAMKHLRHKEALN